MPDRAPLTYINLRNTGKMLLLIVTCYSIIIFIVVSENEKKNVSQFLTNFHEILTVQR